MQALFLQEPMHLGTSNMYSFSEPGHDHCIHALPGFIAGKLFQEKHGEWKGWWQAVLDWKIVFSKPHNPTSCVGAASCGSNTPKEETSRQFSEDLQAFHVVLCEELRAKLMDCTFDRVTALPGVSRACSDVTNRLLGSWSKNPWKIWASVFMDGYEFQVLSYFCSCQKVRSKTSGLSVRFSLESSTKMRKTIAKQRPFQVLINTVRCLTRIEKSGRHS